MRVAIYTRVSTGEQSTSMQLTDLEAVAVRSGWNVVAMHTDVGISGAKGRDKRPGFDALWKQVTRREVDLVAVWAMDRLGRSLIDLVNFAAHCDAKGVGMYFHAQAIDTTTPQGRMFYQIMGAVAQFEREMIRTRVRAGVAAARARGQRWGKKATITPEIIAKVAELKTTTTMGWIKIGKAVGIPPTNVRTAWHKHLAAQAQNDRPADPG